MTPLCQAMADPVGRRDPLPSLSFLDMEKVKRETLGFSHHAPSTINMPAPPLASPSTTYSGPPPPYSYPSSASSSVMGGNNGAPGGHAPGNYTPSQSRQPSGDDKDQAYHATNHPLKQTLPPITEALSIPSILTTNAPPRTSLIARSPTSPVYRSNQEPVSGTRRDSYQHSSPSQSRPYESNRPNMDSFSPQLVNNYHTNPSFSNASYNPIPASQPPRTLPDLASYARQGAPSLPQHSQVSPIITNPPPLRHEATPHSATSYPYQAAYSYPPSTPSVTSYQQPTFDKWRNGGNIDQERAEEVRKALPKDSPPNKPAYGEYVKRHLDIFDLETSLNEIAEGSGRTLEFARLYGAQAHQTQRSGPIPGSFPTLSVCDDMIKQQKCVLDSMARIRDVILKQQQALAEQRKYDQQIYKPAPDDQDQGSHHFADRGEGSGGFAGADAKKRRGRAAPPGRCRSCNRAETPEWRRGPDGARTLCNACGLHYAKVTRKMGNKATAGSSNLRPKEDPSSP